MFIKGLIAAPHTPFDASGNLAVKAIDRQVEFLLSQPIAGVFVGGSTGECASLSVAERETLCTHWAEALRGNPKKLIVHVGSNCLPDAVQLARHAGSQDVDAIAALAPSYFRPSSVEELISYLKPVAGAATDVPFYFYDIPVLTRVELSMVEFLDRGGNEIPSLNGLKYTNSNLVQLQECLQRFGNRFDLLFGCDEMLLAGLSLGTQGAVGSTYNFAAPLYQRIINAFDEGEIELARTLQARSVELINSLSEFGFLSAAKAAMKLIGVDCGPPRLPLRELSNEQYSKLESQLDQLGILADAAKKHPMVEA